MEKELITVHTRLGKSDAAVKEPKILSRRNKEYYNLASRLIVGDINSLCEILMNPREKIFTPQNIKAIRHYDGIKIGEKEYYVGYSASDILLLVKDKSYDQNEVLHDTSKIASSEIKEKVYHYLHKAGYLKIDKS